MTPKLNPEQQTAVEHVHGPLLILAGAGSGKTRVLTHRMANLIQNHNVSPDSIFAVTFTNKAAREMRERVLHLIGPMARGMWITTFHSACLRILRAHATAIGYPNEFVVFDGGDQLSTLKEICKTMNLDEKRFPPMGFVQAISRSKDQCLTPADIADGKGVFMPKLAEVYELYEKRLKEARALDFGDLIFRTVQLLEKNAEIADLYQRQFEFVMVDEYQDTNHAQYRLTNILAGKNRNLCIVGDPDQSVYGWRGADIQNILSFENDYSDGRTILLEQNYRSTEAILKAANAVILQNKGRRPKNLWTANQGGAPITVHGVSNDLDEASAVVRLVREHASAGTYYNDQAVFYRTNAQSRVLEEALRRARVPYVIYGGTKFYERMEVKDVISYLRLCQNPHDNVSFMRAVQTPSRGIGKTTLARLQVLAAEMGISLFEATSRLDAAPDINAAARKRLSDFASFIAHLQSGTALLKMQEIVPYIIDASGYLAYLRALPPQEATDRLANVEELTEAMAEYGKQNADADSHPTLGGFLDQAALVSDIDSLDEGQGVLPLMTLHLAKGLEFPVVYMVGMEEGLLPHRSSLDQPDELEEERRLCYVGITRAREKLHMLYAFRRRVYGNEQYNIPSRFLKDIPKELLEWKKVEATRPSPSPYGGGSGRGGAHSYRSPERTSSTPHWAGDDDFDQTFTPTPHVGSSVSKSVHPEPVEGFSQDTSDGSWKIGMKVKHPQFGEGVIRRIEGKDDKTKLTVYFGPHVVKTLMVQYAQLSPM